MKCERTHACPGCHKHCPFGKPRCKYGRAYFEKQQRAEAAALERNQRKAPKWAAFVTDGGLLWQLLRTGKSVKKTLRRKQTAEAELLSLFTAQEQDALTALLEKLRLAVEQQDAAAQTES